MSKTHGGKGDKPRKPQISDAQYRANWDAIFKKVFEEEMKSTKTEKKNVR